MDITEHFGIHVNDLEGLWVVRGGRNLFWPKDVANPGISRGAGGYVVDLSVPYEKILCKDQQRALQPAPEGAVPDVIDYGPAVRWLRNNGYSQPEPSATPQASAAEVIEGNASDVQEPSPSGLPDLDQTSARKPKRRLGPHSKKEA